MGRGGGLRARRRGCELRRRAGASGCACVPAAEPSLKNLLQEAGVPPGCEATTCPAVGRDGRLAWIAQVGVAAGSAAGRRRPGWCSAGRAWRATGGSARPADPQSRGLGEQLAASSTAERTPFFRRPAAVDLDGAHRDVELVGDDLVELAGQHQAHHLVLARGELGDAGGDGGLAGLAGLAAGVGGEGRMTRSTNALSSSASRGSRRRPS